MELILVLLKLAGAFISLVLAVASFRTGINIYRYSYWDELHKRFDERKNPFGVSYITHDELDAIAYNIYPPISSRNDNQLAHGYKYYFKWKKKIKK